MLAVAASERIHGGEPTSFAHSVLDVTAHSRYALYSLSCAIATFVLPVYRFWTATRVATEGGPRRDVPETCATCTHCQLRFYDGACAREVALRGMLVSVRQAKRRVATQQQPCASGSACAACAGTGARCAYHVDNLCTARFRRLHAACFPQGRRAVLVCPTAYFP